MNLSAIRPSFSELSPEARLQFIMDIRFRRRTNAEAKQRRASRAASKPGATKCQKSATKCIDNISADQAAQLLALLGAEEIETDG